MTVNLQHPPEITDCVRGLGLPRGQVRKAERLVELHPGPVRFG